MGSLESRISGWNSLEASLFSKGPFSQRTSSDPDDLGTSFPRPLVRELREFMQILTLKNSYWAAANGGVTNGGLRGVWPPFLEIGQNRPFSAFFALFRRVPRAPEKSEDI